MSSHFPADVEQLTHGSVRTNIKERIYENIENDEQIVLSLGRHWTQLSSSVFRTILFAILPLIAWSAVFMFFNYPPILTYGAIITWFWYCFTYYLLLTNIVMWRSDIYVITNERIIDFDSTGFNKKVSDIDLGSIHEVHYEVGGGLILGRLDRGDIKITDVSGHTTSMKNLPMPAKIALALGELIEEAQAREGHKAAESKNAPHII